MPRSTRTGIALAVLIAAAAVSLAVSRRRDGVPPPPPMVPSDTRRRGTPEDRGTNDTLGLDVEALRGSSGFEPVVQYLTYIQAQRGEESHLLFVRFDDIDAMAAIEGTPAPAFLERLERLGVVVSTN